MEELKKILCVEDDPDILTVVTTALVTSGLSVLACNSGQEALEKVVTFGPDLILLDVLMPGMNGPATLKALHEFPEIKNIPVIFMTALAQPREISHLKKMGVLDVIAKPFDPMSLADQIGAMWSKRGGQTLSK